MISSSNIAATMVGTLCGRYRITRRIAAGGMGEVYAAVHVLTKGEAVVKMLLPEISAKKRAVQRFFVEAEAAMRIKDPGIVRVSDMGYADNGQVYIVMEKLEGETLKSRLRRLERLSIEHAVVYGRQLARAVGAAHKLGIVHRDLKPDNLFLVPDAEVPGGERIKVLDFGLAKLVEEQGKEMITRTGAVIGTPTYMSPEQCSDAATVDHRSDLYSIGCILYECLAGKPPFGRGGIELIAAHLRDKPWPVKSIEPLVPDSLDAIVMQLLAKNPGDRFQTCKDLVRALEQEVTQPGVFSMDRSYDRTGDSGRYAIKPSVSFVDRSRGSASGEGSGSSSGQPMHIVPENTPSGLRLVSRAPQAGDDLDELIASISKLDELESVEWPALLAPFTGRINLQVLPYYAEELNTFAELRKFNIHHKELIAAARELINSQSATEKMCIPYAVDLSDAMLIELRRKCDESGLRHHVERAFCRAYNRFAQTFMHIFDSDDALSKRVTASMLTADNTNMKRARELAKELGIAVVELERALTFL